MAMLQCPRTGEGCMQSCRSPLACYLEWLNTEGVLRVRGQTAPPYEEWASRRLSREHQSSTTDVGSDIPGGGAC